MARHHMAGNPPSTKSSTALVAILAVVIIVGVLICAGLFFKSSFRTSGQPQSSGKTKPAAGIAGHYTGYTTIQTGICSVGAHELVIDIDEDGTARSDYDMKPGSLLTGRPNPDGKLKMNYHDNGLTVRFEGEVKGGRITGRTYVSDDHTCDIYWDLAKG
jgi:hypothetical protein